MKAEFVFPVRKQMRLYTGFNETKKQQMLKTWKETAFSTTHTALRFFNSGV